MKRWIWVDNSGWIGKMVVMTRGQSSLGFKFFAGSEFRWSRGRRRCCPCSGGSCFGNLALGAWRGSWGCVGGCAWHSSSCRNGGRCGPWRSCRSCGVGCGLLLDLVPDHQAGCAVVQLLHEVPCLDSGHPGAVRAVDRDDLVANLQRTVLVGRTT